MFTSSAGYLVYNNLIKTPSGSFHRIAQFRHIYNQKKSKRSRGQRPKVMIKFRIPSKENDEQLKSNLKHFYLL